MKLVGRKNKITKSRKTGFTLVELSLSIAFIAVLSIAVVLIITNSISAYHRGLTLTQINTTGADLVSDIRAAIQNAPARSIVSECSNYYNKTTIQDHCKNDGAHNFVSVTRDSTVQVGNNTIGTNNIPVFGAFCTGSYSYLWNTGYFFHEDYRVTGVSSATLKYRKAGTEVNSNPVVDTISNFKLLKVKDESRSVCISAVRGADTNSNAEVAKYRVDRYGNNSINKGSNVFDITSYDVVSEEPMDILSGFGVGLAIYDLTSATPAEGNNSKNLFYSVSFILGSIQGGINVKSSGNFCATPNGFNSSVENFDYCAINKFNFAAQAVGG